MDVLKISKSDFSINETVNRIVNQINQNGWHLFACIDHSKEAKKKGLKLRPTVLILFGNPEIGTLLMQDNQISAIDLPMKILAWEDETGQVHIASINLAWIKKRHGLTDDATIGRIEKVVENICIAGSKKTPDNKLRDKGSSGSSQSDNEQGVKTTLSSPVCYANSREVREDFRDE